MATGLKTSPASCSTRSWSQPWPSQHLPGDLRPYQQAGLNWLGFLDALGFGACLADDMGLGKTIQLLAFLSVKKPQKTTSLLVVPASLMANWRHEIDRYYPELAYYVAHPGGARRPRSRQPCPQKPSRSTIWSSPPTPWCSATTCCRPFTGTT